MRHRILGGSKYPVRIKWERKGGITMSKPKAAFFLVFLLLALGILFLGQRSLQGGSLTITGQDGKLLVKLVDENRGPGKEESQRERKRLAGDLLEAYLSEEEQLKANQSQGALLPMNRIERTPKESQREETQGKEEGPEEDSEEALQEDLEEENSKGSPGTKKESWRIEEGQILETDIPMDYCLQRAILEAASVVMEQEHLSSLREAKEWLLKHHCELSTTLDLSLQKLLLQAIQDQVGGSVSASLTLCDGRGRLLATYSQKGGEGEAYLQAEPKQAASTMKPLASYGLALEKGLITFSTLFPDAPLLSGPIELAGTGLDEWPSNWLEYTGKDITAWEALAWSNNAVAIRILKLLGPESVSSFLEEAFGFDTKAEKERLSTYGPEDLEALERIALGDPVAGISQLELTDAYQAIANGGVVTPLYCLTGIKTGNGKIVYRRDDEGEEEEEIRQQQEGDKEKLGQQEEKRKEEELKQQEVEKELEPEPEPEPEEKEVEVELELEKEQQEKSEKRNEKHSYQAFTPETAYLLNRLLRCVVAEGTGKEADGAVEICGKTGTGDGYEDNLFVGMTPDYVCGAWYEGMPAEAKHDKAIRMVKEVLTEAPCLWREFIRPSSIEELPYCTESGGIATKNCRSTQMGYYATGSLPSPCRLHGQ